MLIDSIGTFDMINKSGTKDAVLWLVENIAPLKPDDKTIIVSNLC